MGEIFDAVLGLDWREELRVQVNGRGGGFIPHGCFLNYGIDFLVRFVLLVVFGGDDGAGEDITLLESAFVGRCVC